jgi:putative membrane protein
MWEILAGCAVGVGMGVVSGLLPGIHVNTLAGIMLASQAVLLPLFGSGLLVAALIAALVTHCFLDAIPSTFLGVPDADTAVSVLPAHALCLEGRGEEAVRIAALGSAWGLVIGIPLCCILLLVMPALQPFLDWWTGIILVAVIGFLLARSESPGWGLLVFLSSGALGAFAFRFSYLAPPSAGEGGVLMPLLSGLFGIAILIFAGQGPVPRQTFRGISMEPGTIVRGSVLGAAAGTMVGWMPGLSNATANSVLVSAVDLASDRRGYLLATSAANTVNAVVGLAAFFAISRTRNGVVAAMSIMEAPPLSTLLLVSAAAGLAAYLITVSMAGMAQMLAGFDRQALNRVVMAFVAAVCLLVTGAFGMVILVLATALGCVPRLVNVSQVYCMGAITLPVMLYSFGVAWI